MGKYIILDTGFWYALYNQRDKHHEEACLYSDYLDPHYLLVPWPTLYETLNTRFTRRRSWLSSFEAYIKKPRVITLPDEDYKTKALNTALQPKLPHQAYSLVDLVIREILSDYSVKIDAIITFNFQDFADICQKRQIELFNG